MLFPVETDDYLNESKTKIHTRLQSREDKFVAKREKVRVLKISEILSVVDMGDKLNVTKTKIHDPFVHFFIESREDKLVGERNYMLYEFISKMLSWVMIHTQTKIKYTTRLALVQVLLET